VKLSSKRESLGEEIANGITHGIGALLSIVGLVFLVMKAIHDGDPIKVATFSVFGASMVLIYSSSTLYHSFPWPRVKAFFRWMDHAAIYVFIAATYTPFLLLNLRGGSGWWLFAIVWALAISGVLFKLFHIDKFPVTSVLFYLGMGWLAVFSVRETITHVPPVGIGMLVAGGLAYSFGVIFYFLDKMPFNHAVWHCFVMTGTTCHYFAVLKYANA